LLSCLSSTRTLYAQIDARQISALVCERLLPGRPDTLSTCSFASRSPQRCIRWRAEMSDIPATGCVTGSQLPLDPEIT
jgi:hypothetical protein